MFVYKFPNTFTLASIVYSDESPGSGWELMSEQEFEAWKVQQLNEGWVPTKTAEQILEESRKIWPSSADFWSTFTDSEKLAILSSTISGIVLLREELRLWIGEVWSDDAKVQAGLNGLVATGIISEERKVQILSK